MIDDYIKLQELVGNSIDAPGKGGNISVKSDGTMIIKASGQDLKNPHHFASTISHGQFDIKPSMEVKMHENIKSKYVVHYHPVYVLPFLCSDYEFDIGETLDYYAPGDELAEAISNTTNNIVFLRNHGVVIHAETIEEIKQLYGIIKKKFFIESQKMYTPDDVIDSNSTELWLFREYIRMSAEIKGLKLNHLDDDQQHSLKTDPNEIFRKEQM
mgnify:CR=1 FL=1